MVSQLGLGKFPSPHDLLRFIQNPMKAYELWYPIKFDVLDSLVTTNFLKEIVFTKCPQDPISLISKSRVEVNSKNLKIKPITLPTQNQCFRSTGIVHFAIRTLKKILIEVNYKAFPISKKHKLAQIILDRIRNRANYPHT